MARKHTGKVSAVYTRTPEGRWRVRVQGIAEAETSGRTLREARRKLLKKLERLALGLAPELVVDRVHLDAAARRELRGYRAARRRLEREEARVQGSGRQAAVALTEGMGLSVRDAAALLGISPARVQQLLEGE